MLQALSIRTSKCIKQIEKNTVFLRTTDGFGVILFQVQKAANEPSG